MLSVEVDRTGLEKSLQDLDVFPEMGQRGVEVDAHRFHRGTVAGAYAQTETPRRQLGHHLGLLRGNQRVARVGGNDGCA